MSLKVRLFALVLMIASATWVFTGCQERVQGPELRYSQAEVELIEQQIEATDW